MIMRTIALIPLFITVLLQAQVYHPLKVPDTGQVGNYTAVFGEDSDYLLNTPQYSSNITGTVTDKITGLMWQKADGGEMTYEQAVLYCDTLTLGGFTDWRLPKSHELFGILHHEKNRPAMDTLVFTKTTAEYWWSVDKQVDDNAKIWVTNAGGGLGAHLKSETISAGGSKRIHIRAVRFVSDPAIIAQHFTDNGDGTITDVLSGLVWQKILSTNAMTWETALTYCENLSTANYSDWRLPNIKELESINNVLGKNPSVDTSFFKGIKSANYWSSTTLFGQTGKAWYMQTGYGLITYDDKTSGNYTIAVRGPVIQTANLPEVKMLPGGEFVMGDHHGFVDPQHPSDELPMHSVKVDSLYMGVFEISNQQYCNFLNAAKTAGTIEVRNNLVYAAGDTNIFFFTNLYAAYSSIGWDGNNFSVIDFRARHPVVGVMWYGAIAYCNWLSRQQNLPECYNIHSGTCDFTKNGFRLPTEAEWEYAGRAAQYNPYYIFPWGNDSTNFSLANWPGSGDPYETGSYPYTTPIGFYNGQLHLKTEYNWPGAQSSFQTSNGANAFGLYDMAGNVWELINDWYGQNYYSVSPYNNPKGPSSGFIMPDGKPYRGMRGGNWYNGLWGHSRVANRNPSYYRGPQDPNHPWYHIGFRVARYVQLHPSGISENDGVQSTDFQLMQNYPNPCNPSTKITFRLNREQPITVRIYNSLGQLVTELLHQSLTSGEHTLLWNGADVSSGVYLCQLQSATQTKSIKILLLK